ncbi:MAG: DUF4326 domain-containing protein [Rhodospirillales bacterium]|nr:DUF4326 domain-containing protein [Rhodospirillales bacterium]
MTCVHNKRSGTAPANAVYIGRPGKWGNPFQMGRDGSRAEVVEKFSAYIGCRPELQAVIKRELRGKHLVCWCAPAACHGDVLHMVANG